jgi:hypothetical protein
MDDQGLTKIKEIFNILVKFKEEGKEDSQGFNDRVTVAREIYHRNSNRPDFLKAVTYAITNDTKEFLELIKQEPVIKVKVEKKVFKPNPNKPTKEVPGAKKYTKSGTKPANFK